MRLVTTASCLLLSSVLSNVALANPSEVSVCVEVVVRHPTAESSKARNNGADQPASPSATSIESSRANPAENSANPDATAPAVVNVPSPASAALVPAGGANTIMEMPADARMESGAHLPIGQAPEVYLKRLFEHFVTHERGFVAASENCAQKIVVELYPLQIGWAAFARYSGTGREERVDQLLPTELSQFAQRASLALLHDVTISDTVDRDNVLWSDSLRSTQKIRGRNHFVLGLGTRLRGGYFDTAITETSNSRYGSVERSLRLFSPMAAMTGYRGAFDQYGIEALAQFDLGTSQVAAKNNPAGGHVDYLGSVGLVLHVMRYADPRGIASLYYGGGATFELVWFNAILPENQRYGDSRSTLLSGGLNADALIGYEFMRASSVSFFLQGELNLPAYILRSQNDAANLDTWFPGMKLALGANF